MTPFARSGMAGVQVAVVLHRELLRLQRAAHGSVDVLLVEA